MKKKINKKSKNFNSIDIISEINKLAELEKETTRGEWVVAKYLDNEDHFEKNIFIRAEVDFDIKIMSDELYDNKINDAKFIVAVKNFLMKINVK